MLIVPLHKPLNSKTFPYATLALILINCFVYFGLQLGDDHHVDEAADMFYRSGLSELEIPHFIDQLKAEQREEAREIYELAPEPWRTRWILGALQADEDFRAALRAERVITPDHPKYAQWKSARALFDSYWLEPFTQRYLLRFGEFDPVRMFTAMFLHGGIDHLVGNMIFLALLGLLVEGALGAGLYVAVYLLAGLGGNAFSLMWRLDEVGAALGASGAIAGLMGAFGVLWGLRRVRFFYWFLVMFNYTRAPAILLVPFWLGWELFNLLYNTEANVGFDAHAGGIMAGALLAFGVRALRWENSAFMDEEFATEERRDLMTAARNHMGKLDFPAAREAIDAFMAREPGDAEGALLAFRAWQGSPSDDMHRAARRILVEIKSLPGGEKMRRQLFEDYLRASGNKPRLARADLITLSRSLATGAEFETALKLLRAISAKPGTDLAEAALALVRTSLSAGQRAIADQGLALLRTRMPDAPETAKAEFLLANA